MAQSMEEFFSMMQAYSEEHNAQNKSSGKNYLVLSRQIMSDSTSIFRIINDSKGVPMRLIHDVYECWLNLPVIGDDGNPVLDEAGNPTYYGRRYNVCGLSNYKNLSADDIKLVNDTVELCERFSQLDKETLDKLGSNTTYRKEISLWWCKLLAFTGNKDATSGVQLIYLVRNHGNSFFQDYCRAINTKTSMKGSGQWLEKYLNREVGTHEEACSVRVHLGDPDKKEQLGYSYTIAFDTVAPYELTPEDIEMCTDLDAEYINVADFNRDLYTTVRDYLTKVLAEHDMKSATDMGLTPAPEQPKVDAQTAYASYQAPPAPVNAAPQVTPRPAGAPTFTAPRPAGAPVPPMGPPTSL